MRWLSSNSLLRCRRRGEHPLEDAFGLRAEAVAVYADGAANIQELHARARFLRISPAGLRESHVHDVIITKEAPNYRVE